MWGKRRRNFGDSEKVWSSVRASPRLTDASFHINAANTGKVRAFGLILCAANCPIEKPRFYREKPAQNFNLFAAVPIIVRALEHPARCPI